MLGFVAAVVAELNTILSTSTAWAQKQLQQDQLLSPENVLTIQEVMKLLILSANLVSSQGVNDQQLILVVLIWIITDVLNLEQDASIQSLQQLALKAITGLPQGPLAEGFKSALNLTANEVKMKLQSGVKQVQTQSSQVGSTLKMSTSGKPKIALKAFG
eukprot:TRINITY_DN2531_c0_g2_i1.p2 TRINITY_DN2531_c0_g2~~TRINITY_DN2531_c0_g2_i1.p2  ORF type:complete len:174 (-),score=31.62 TRINITY_DN2531_c0_g2_i1:236-712(-)